MPYCHIPIFLNSEASLRWSGGILQEDRNYGKFWTKVIALAPLRHCALQIFVSKSGADFIQTTTMGPGGTTCLVVCRCDHCPLLAQVMCSQGDYYNTACAHILHILYRYCAYFVHILHTFCTNTVNTLYTLCTYLSSIHTHCLDQLTILQFQCTARMRRQMVAFALWAVSQICRHTVQSAKGPNKCSAKFTVSVDPEKMCSMQPRGEADGCPGFWGS